MAYSDVILQDAPFNYVKFNNTVAESGSQSAGAWTAQAIAYTAAGGGITNSDGIGGDLRQTNSVAYKSMNGDGLFSANTSWSMETWFRRGNTNNRTWQNIILREEGTAKTLIRIDDSSTTNGNKIVGLLRTSAGQITVVGPTVLNTDWHHVVMTYTSGGSLVLYLDGVQVGSTASIGGTATFSTSPLYIGAYGAGTDNENFFGFVDEFATYKSALTPAKVAAHNNAGRGVSNGSPVMVLNLTTPNVNVTAVNQYIQKTGVSADRRAIGGTASETTILTGTSYNNNNGGLFRVIMPTAPADGVFQSAKFRVNIPNSVSTQNAGIYPITQDWVESGTTNVSINTGVSRGFNTTQGINEVDITNIINYWNAGNPNYGIAIIYNASGVSVGPFFSTRESTTPPQMVTTYQEIVRTPVRVQAPAMSATLNMPQHRVGSGTKQTVPVMSTLALSSITPNVRTTRSTLINAPVFNSNMTFLGGEVKLRDQVQRTTPMVAYLTSQNANIIIGKDAKSTAPVMNAGTLSAVAPKVDNKTSKTNYVIGNMNLSLRFPSNIAVNGKRGDDRYAIYIPLTTDDDDIWYRMDELSGTTALDSISNGENLRNNGSYVGPVQFNVNGPYDRRAVRYNGTSTYLAVNYSEGFFFGDGTDLTVEFSIKTTQKDGVLWTTRGSRSSARLKNGFIELIDDENTLYRVRKDIADNQWHHVVMSMPKTNSSGQLSNQRPFFVQVDGVVEYRRYDGITYVGNQIAPVQFMKLAGDSRDLVIRIKSAVDERTAAKAYYEWSNATIVSAPPMTLNLSAVAPNKVRGNIKKMLVVHGLPWSINNQGHFLHNYKSLFANYYINTKNAINGPGGNDWTYDDQDYVVNPASASGVSTIGASNVFYDVKPFRLDDLFVYPVGITGSIDRSADGLINNDYRGKNGQFTDDKTGLPRFIDVNSDLNVDLDEFDILTVMNYPAPAPYAARDSFYPRQPDLGLSNFEWSQAREKFRDDIMKAVNKGMSLWVNEPEFATHIGLISGYDVHTIDDWSQIYQPGDRNLNKAGYELDKSKLRPGTQMITLGLTGDYFSRPQANRFRRIVATEPGLTDIPSWTIGRKIEHYTYDPYISNGLALAYEALDHTGGLKIGDQVPMSVDIFNRTLNNNNFTSLGSMWRDKIVSARPDGIAGKVIAREQLSYNQPDTTNLKVNPWRNNVTTIAAEKGTVIRGSAIGGRIFMELMDMDVNAFGIYVDKDKKKWRGDSLPYQTSFWDFDLRRYQEILVTILVQKFMYNNESGTFEVKNVRIDILNIENGIYDTLPYYSMNARGLKWLAAADSVPAGDSKNYAPSMEINVSMGDVNIRRTRNVSTKVTGFMRTDLEMRNTANFKPNSVSNKALPMYLNLELRGLGKVVSVPPMEITLTSPSNITANGGGDRIIVYINNDRNITTFLKENN